MFKGQAMTTRKKNYPSYSMTASVILSCLLVFLLISHLETVQGLTLASVFQPSINHFQQTYPNISFTLNTDLHANTEFTLRTIQSLFSRKDSSIDVFLIDVIWPGDLAEHFIDLRDYFTEEERNKYFSALIENNTVNKKLLAIPWYFNVGLLYYRKDLLEKYGYSGPPKTWDELEIMATKIQEGERAAGDSDFWGWTWNGYPAEGLTCIGLEFLGGCGAGSIIEKGGDGKLKITVDNPKSLSMIERAKKWIGTISPYSVVHAKEKDAETIWLARKTAFLRNWPTTAGITFKDAFLGNKFGVASLPGITPGSGKAAIGGWNLAISKYSKNIEDSVKLVRFLTSAPELKDLALNVGRLPTMPEVMVDPEICSTPRTKFMCETQLGDSLLARPSTISSPNYNTASQLFYIRVNAALSGKMEPLQALKLMSRDLNDLFQLADSSFIRSFTAKNWMWFGPSLSVLILIILTTCSLYIVIPAVTRMRHKSKIHNKGIVSTEQVPSNGSTLASSDSAHRSLRPSIRSIIILLFVLLIVITSLSAWLLSWSNGRQSAQELGVQLRENILQRIKESAENSILTAQALGKGGSLTIDYASSVISSFVPTVTATANTRIAVIERKNGTVIATSGVKTKRGLSLIESGDVIVKDTARYILKHFGSYDNTEFKHGVEYKFVSDEGRVFVEGVSVYDPSGIAWIILIIVPEYDIMGKIHRGTLITLIVSIVVIMVSVFFSLIFSYVITKPLSTLVKQMERVTEMDLDSAGQISSSIFHEVFAIQTVFQRMVEMMREYKSYMPSSLFVEDAEEEEDGRRSIDTSKILGSVSDMATPQYTPSINGMLSLDTSVTGTSDSSHSSMKTKHGNRKATRIELSPKQYTVMIINIEDFNVLLEVLSMKDVIKIHSDYVDSMTRIIAHHRGSYDRFVADKIVGSFNTALNCSTHVESACRCALACQDKISKLQKTWTKLGFPHIKVRIGISCGAGYCGNMGSASVRAYSVLGTTVNVASSLEQLNKEYRTKILIDDKTFNAAKSKIVARTVDIVPITKLSQANSMIRVYELIQMRNIKGDEWMYEMQESERYNQAFNNYEDGFQAFINQDYDRCVQCMKQQLQESPNDYQAERILGLAQEYTLRPTDRYSSKRVD